MDAEVNGGCHTLIIEPFYGGSHQQLVDLVMANAPSCAKYTLPAKKWHWKARTSALHFAQIIPRNAHYKVLFGSSVLNLAELVALRTDLLPLHKVLYFHENQLVYPVKKQQDRDFQYGYNQIISCLVADTILFNSSYNMESFLSAIDSFLSLIPVAGFKSKDLHKPIRRKCRVLHFPLQIPNLDSLCMGTAGGCRPFSPQTRKPQSDPAGPGPGSLSEDKPLGHSEDVVAEKVGPKGKPASPEAKVGEEGLVRRNARRPSSEIRRRVDRSQTLTQSVAGSEGEAESSDQAGDKEEGFSQLEEEVKSLDIKDVTARDKRAYWKSHSHQPLHILWAHRWEHDKNPELFFQTVLQLSEMGLEFQLSVLGEQFSEVPEIFAEAKSKLQDHIVNWGFIPSKEDYYRVLFTADVAVSTANHEFFGVAMLEAVHFGCYPVCPNSLVYPEIFPKEYLYSTPQQLYKRLREFCRHPHLVRSHSLQVDLKRFSWEELEAEYLSILAPRSAVKMRKKVIRPSP